MTDAEQPFADLEATLKKAACALRGAGIPFLLGGSLASWARGGPESRHDLDLMLREADAGRALAALEEAGMRPEHPPEEWLVKAWDGDVLVDLIFWPKGLPIDDAVLARGETMSVLAMDMQVMAIEDVLITKLMALNEHALRYEGLLEIARALREQVEWPHVRAATAESPFARAFFVLLEGLAILPEQPAAPGGARVRVITSARSEAEGRG
ncbi:MAG: nucleotidyltransferase [Solirubrobacteraceae bacterium]